MSLNPLDQIALLLAVTAAFACFNHYVLPGARRPCRAGVTHRRRRNFASLSGSW
jgi:hypothetical protein